MKIKRIAAIVVLFILMFNMTAFSEYKAPQGIWYANVTRNSSPLAGAVMNTPSQWKFKYDGQEFIILDTFEKDGKMNFFIMTESLYGNHVFSTATKEPYGWFEPKDEKNIAYWLNNDFWNNGNGDKKLPDAIKDYIIENSWVTEPLRDDAGTGHVPEGYKSTALAPVAKCKLALLADWEWKAYIDKIGYPGGTWFLRSVRTVDIKNSTSNVLCVSNGLGYNATSPATGKAIGIRPVFMLSSDFFYDNKITEAGSEVVKLIDAYCNPGLYTDDEKKEVFGWPDAVISEIRGNAVIGQELEVMYDYYGTFEEADTEFKWYRSSDLNSGYVEISGANKKTYKVTDADDDKYIKAMVIPKSKSVMAEDGYPVESYPIGPVFGTSKVNQAIDEVKNASSENVISVIEKYNAVFEVDTSLGGLSDEEKKNALVIFANADFESIDELRIEYERATALAKLNANKDVEKTPEYINEALHLDFTRYEVLENRDDIYSAVTDKGYEKFSDFEKDFYEAVCMLDINNSDRNTIKAVLLAHTHILSADFSKLTEYQLGLVGTETLSKMYDDFSKLDKTVSDAVEEALKNNDVPDSPMISDNIEERDEGKSNGTGIVPMIPQNTKVYEAKQGNYIDIAEAEWARESIMAMTKKGIVSGYGDGTFCPNLPLTREAFVKIIVGAFYPDVQGFKTSTVFSDVKSEKWYSMYINIAYENGIINGISDTEFGIGQNITREDMAVIISRVTGVKADNITLSFADSDEISGYAKDAVSALVSDGFISGYGDGTFKPKEPATRAMAVKVIYEILKSDNKI